MSISVWNRAVAYLSHWWGWTVRTVLSCSSSTTARLSGNAKAVSLSESELPQADHISVGSVGEAIALMHLKQLGYRLIEQNFRILGGELDLIMADHASVVFVEVKSLVTTTKDDPGEAVDDRKQRILTRGALAYLKQKGWLERPARFDVVTIQFTQHPKLYVDAATKKIDLKRLMKTAFHVEHYRNAFEATGDGFYG